MRRLGVRDLEGVFEFGDLVNDASPVFDQLCVPVGFGVLTLLAELSELLHLLNRHPGQSKTSQHIKPADIGF